MAGATQAVSIAQARRQLAALIARGSSDPDVVAAIADLRALLVDTTGATSVLDYGAVGDGVTDDTVAIKAAIAAVVAAGRGALTFSGLSYKVSSVLLIAGLNDFVIDGKGATITMANGVTCDANGAILRLSGCSRGTIVGFTLDGNRANRAPSALAQDSNLELANCNDLEIRRVIAKNSCLDGVYVYSSTPANLATACTNLTFVACKSDNAYRNGVSVIQGINVQFVGCQFVNSNGAAPQAGVDLESNPGDADGSIDGVRFTDCDFTGNTGLGLSIVGQSKSRNVSVNACRFSACAAGAISIGARDVVVQGCRFHDFTASTRGIVDVPSPTTATWNRDIVIEGCVWRDITAAGKAALYVHGSSGGRVRMLGCDLVNCVKGVDANAEHIEIVGNRFETLSGNAISLDTSSYDRIADNTFRSVASYTVFGTNACSYLEITGNTLIDCNNVAGGAAQGNILVQGAATRIANNHLALITTPDAAALGILAFGATCTCEVQGNRCVGYSTNSAINAQSGATLSVSGVNPGWGEGSAAIDPANLAAGSEQTLATTITVPGAAVGDAVQVFPPYDLQGCIVTGYVSAANTVSVRQRNGTGGAIDLGNGTWKARISR